MLGADPTPICCGFIEAAVRIEGVGMRIERRFTQENSGPYEGIRFVERTSRIVEPDGRVIFECEGVVVPEFWSQVATDVLAQKYFRKAGVPARLRTITEKGVPSWLWRSAPDTKALAELPAENRLGMEKDCRQVFHRLAGCWTYWPLLLCPACLNKLCWNIGTDPAKRYAALAALCERHGFTEVATAIGRLQRALAPK